MKQKVLSVILLLSNFCAASAHGMEQAQEFFDTYRMSINANKQRFTPEERQQIVAWFMQEGGKVQLSDLYHYIMTHTDYRAQLDIADFVAKVIAVTHDVDFSRTILCSASSLAAGSAGDIIVLEQFFATLVAALELENNDFKVILKRIREIVSSIKINNGHYYFDLPAGERFTVQKKMLELQKEIQKFAVCD